MTPKIKIRPYAESDWVTICRIHDAARPVELQLAGLSGAFVPLKKAAINEDLFDDTVLVAERAGAVVGFVAYSADELAWLYVDQTQAHTGIGRALAQAALAAAPGIVNIEVLAGNLPARRLYESLGFTLGEIEHGHMPGNERFAVTVWVLHPTQKA